MNRPVRLGLNVWSHATTWPDILQVARQAEYLGYDDLFTADHLLATVGDPHQPILEGWTLLSALAASTNRLRIGPLVLANTFRHPALVAKMAVTLDQVSNGRAVLGLGAGWFAQEHDENGIAFGSTAGERLTWLAESAEIIRRLLDGAAVTFESTRYRLTGARQSPSSIQSRLPILIGGTGPERTLPIVARWADEWNAIGDAGTLAERSRLLDELCLRIGREPSSIDRSVTVKAVVRDRYEDARARWIEQCQRNGMQEDTSKPLLGPPEHIAEQLDAYISTGFETVIIDLPAPYDLETITRFIEEIRPLLSNAMKGISQCR
jgi:alkanesulfonate monooxygenase SsuD/methylene tetrahydromethanopterin reductase-like flavin-dependent oxidoreductase (luciferase family)